MGSLSLASSLPGIPPSSAQELVPNAEARRFCLVMPPKRPPPPPPSAFPGQAAAASGATKRARSSPASKGKAPATFAATLGAAGWTPGGATFTYEPVNNPPHMPDATMLARQGFSMKDAAAALTRYYALDSSKKDYMALQHAKMSVSKYAGLVKTVIQQMSDLPQTAQNATRILQQAPPPPPPPSSSLPDPRMEKWDESTQLLAREIKRQGMPWNNAVDAIIELRRRRLSQGRSTSLSLDSQQDYDEAMEVAFDVVDLTGGSRAHTAAHGGGASSHQAHASNNGSHVLKPGEEPPPPKNAQEEELLRKEAEYMAQAMRESLEEEEKRKKAEQLARQKMTAADTVKQWLECGTYASLNGIVQAASNFAEHCAACDDLAHCAVDLAKLERRCRDWYPTVRHGVDAHFSELGREAMSRLKLTSCPVTDKAAQHAAIEGIREAHGRVNQEIARMPANPGELPSIFIGNAADQMDDGIVGEDDDGVIIVD